MRTFQDIRHGRKLSVTREHVFRKTGELFALRHQLNLSSDYLDTPDFYWDRADLELLFNKTIRLYSIERRTKVMNEKINHCQELMELISHHLEDKHHVRYKDGDLRTSLHNHRVSPIFLKWPSQFNSDSVLQAGSDDHLTDRD